MVTLKSILTFSKGGSAMKNYFLGGAILFSMLAQIFEHRAMEVPHKKQAPTLLALCLDTIEKHKKTFKATIDDYQAQRFAEFLFAHYCRKAMPAYTYLLYADLCPRHMLLTPEILKNAPTQASQKTVKEKVHFFELRPKLLKKSSQEFFDKNSKLRLTT